jgi:hypothetical protein
MAKFVMASGRGCCSFCRIFKTLATGKSKMFDVEPEIGYQNMKRPKNVDPSKRFRPLRSKHHEPNQKLNKFKNVKAHKSFQKRL